MDLILRVPDTTWSVTVTAVFDDPKTGDPTIVSGMDCEFTNKEDLEDGMVIDMTEEEE